MGGAKIPQVVVYPPEEEEQEVFRSKDDQDHEQDPHSHSGKYLSARLSMLSLHTNMNVCSVTSQSEN